MAATCRVIAGPTPGTDNSVHKLTLTDSVAAGETIVFLSGLSLYVTEGLVGFADVDTGPYLSFDCEYSAISSNGRGISCFSAYSPNGVASGTTLRFSVKYTAGAYYHGQSPYAVALALNSGDGRYMVFDTYAAADTNLDTTPHTPSITSAADAIILGFFAGYNSGTPGWWTPDGGETEFADEAAGTESGYCIAGNYRIVTSPYTGASGGTLAGSTGFGTLIASYKATSAEPNRGPTILAGSREVGVTVSNDFWEDGHTGAFPFVCATTGTSTQMGMTPMLENDTPSAITGVKLGVYTHDSGNNRPGTLIASGTVSPDPVKGGRFMADVVASLNSGTTYWLACSSHGQRFDLAGVASTNFGRESLTEMPGTWSQTANMQVQPAIWIEQQPTGITKAGTGIIGP